jgi:hypothetical protein
MTPTNPTTTPPQSGPQQNTGAKPADADRQGKHQSRGNAGAPDQQAGDKSRPSDAAAKPGEPSRDAAIPLGTGRDEGKASQPNPTP